MRRITTGAVGDEYHAALGYSTKLSSRHGSRSSKAACDLKMVQVRGALLLHLAFASCNCG